MLPTTPPHLPGTDAQNEKKTPASDVPSRAERRLEAALSLDGLSVRLHLVGEELVIVVDDPLASLDASTLLDTHSHEAGSASARTVAARMRPGGDIDSEAVHALSRAVALSGRAEMWGGTMTRVRDFFQLLRPEDPGAITSYEVGLRTGRRHPGGTASMP